MIHEAIEVSGDQGGSRVPRVRAHGVLLRVLQNQGRRAEEDTSAPDFDLFERWGKIINLVVWINFLVI